MASAEELLFTPAEYQVIEEFEFEEEIQRPEEIRFFTYEEQASDFVEKLLPTTGRIAKAVIRKAEYEVDSFTKLHKKIVEETAEGFKQQEYTRPLTLPWVHYKNTNPLQTTEYTWQQKWSPLFADANGMNPNFYLLLLDSLPKSGVYYTGDAEPVFTNGVAKIEDHLFLDKYAYTKVNYREDGSYSTETVQREGTQDVAKFTGYSVDNPPLAPPNPLAEHPFLSVHPNPIALESTEPLPELLPTLEAIFEHAVPETPKPYTEGLRYLKIFDIQLRDVPDSLWTKKFPPEAVVEETPAPTEVSFPTREADAPSKNLVDAYGVPWYSSLSSRKWLSSQVDGGTLVPLMLLSQAGDVGVAAIPPPVVFPEGGVIEGTPEDCMPPEITDFQDFLTRGVYRAPKCANCGAVGHAGHICPDKAVKTDYKAGYGCFPLSFVHKEREDAPYTNKKPWTPGTHDQILKDHQVLLTKFKDYSRPAFTKYPPAAASEIHNETRLMIVSILDDEAKPKEDKLQEIQALVKDTPLENHVYSDPETKAFLICEHELEILSGEYDKNPKEYLKKWCVKESGFYVCQYSGEPVSEVLDAQDQFDEEGRPIGGHDAISSPGAKSHDLSFASSMQKLQSAFKSNPAEDIMYLLISLIQVLPEDSQLKVYLDYVREKTEDTKRHLAGKKLGAKESGKVDSALAIYGFSALVMLLQTHMPQLIPRRSFGSKPLVLRGFPRDTDDSNDAPLVDSLLNALIQTFESYPTTFRGSSVVFLRSLLNDRKGIRKAVVLTIKNFAKNFSSQLAEARDNLEAVAVGYTPIQSFNPPPVRPEKEVSFLPPTGSVMTKPEMRYTCMADTPWLVPSTRYSFRQDATEIVEVLKPSRRAVGIHAEAPPIGSVPEKSEIARRLKLKAEAGVFKNMAKEDHPGTLQSLLLRCLNLIAEETVASRELRQYIQKVRNDVVFSTADASLRRDLCKGYILELGVRLSENQAVSTQFERAFGKDVTIRSLLSNAGESRKHVDNLKTREREEFKARLRRMPDAQRDVTTKLIDLGLAPYLITKDDREAFMKELQEKLGEEAGGPEPEPEPQEDNPPDIPEEGLHDDRDVGPQGEVPYNGEQALEVDYGDYGDMRARTADGEEYQEAAAYD